jgi:urocanate hydratase
MCGAQPLAATLNGACFLVIEVDPARIEKRLRTGYCDRIAWNLDDALTIVNDARQRGDAFSLGLVGNCADVLPELARRLCKGFGELLQWDGCLDDSTPRMRVDF